MPDEQDKAPSAGGLRFRLPKLFAEAEDEAPQTAGTTNMDTSPIPRAPSAALPPAELAARPPVPPAAPVAPAAPPPAPPVHAPGVQSPTVPTAAAPVTPSVLSQQLSESVALLRHDLQEMRGGMHVMLEALLEIGDRESSQEKVFDLLHSELSSYKNDFIYEHLKPVVRQLLFLFDSLEQFETEITQYQRPDQDERRAELSPRLVRENIHYFREQLVEALRICEVTLMDEPQGAFDPKLHKAIDVVAVPAAQDNTIQRVVRSGWYLNGQLLRPAEVVVGKRK
jgi:molecular chaperone GrpE (heat shock protein)